MDHERALLTHFLAAIAYRTQKALRGAPATFPDFSAGHQVRTPVEILRHMTSLMGYTRTMFVGGSYPMKPDALGTFDAEIERFHETIAAVCWPRAPRCARFPTSNCCRGRWPTR